MPTKSWRTVSLNFSKRTGPCNATQRLGWLARNVQIRVKARSSLQRDCAFPRDRHATDNPDVVSWERQRVNSRARNSANRH